MVGNNLLTIFFLYNCFFLYKLNKDLKSKSFLFLIKTILLESENFGRGPLYRLLLASGSDPIPSSSLIHINKEGIEWKSKTSADDILLKAPGKQIVFELQSGQIYTFV